MSTLDFSTTIGNAWFPAPTFTASGCASSGRELAQFFPLRDMGGVVTKSVMSKVRPGRPTPRMAETPSGMLNSIGLQGPGIDAFLAKDVPYLVEQKARVIVSIAGETVEEYSTLARKLRAVSGISAIEVNISCPNLEADGMAFAVSAEATFKVISEIRAATAHPIWAKLSPNAASIASIAKAAEDAGADAIVMGNTILGMAIDARTRKPKLGNVMGGLSGPAIKPIALRLVHQCYRQVRIPIIGCGGISNAEDAVEFMLAGASAVQVGTASFIDPGIMGKIIDGLQAYCLEMGVDRISELTGQLDADPLLPARWLRFAEQSL